MNMLLTYAIAALLLLLSSRTAHAQVITEGPIPAGAQFVWEAPTTITTVTEALTFEPRLYLDTRAATALTSVSCASAGSVITCTAAVSSANRDALNQVGAHQVTLALFRADIGEGAQSLPFVLTSRAGAPTGLRITR